MSKPALVLVHGSWHSPKHFGPIAKDLESHGFKCVLVALPSTQSPDTPPANLTDDTNAVRSAVISELDADNNVVVVAHSYGGVPSINGLKDLDSKTRAAQGNTTSVKSLIFISAISFTAGTSMLQVLAGRAHPIHDLRVPEFSWVGPPGPEHYFYNEMEPEEAEEWAGELRPQSWAAYEEETTYAGYKDFKCFYLKCRKDQALRWEMQEGILKGMEADGAVVETETFDSDHTPFVGKFMERTSEWIRGIAERE